MLLAVMHYEFTIVCVCCKAVQSKNAIVVNEIKRLCYRPHVECPFADRLQPNVHATDFELINNFQLTRYQSETRKKHAQNQLGGSIRFKNHSIRYLLIY